MGTGVKPLCMTPEELVRWHDANRTLNEPAATPCFDCVEWWAELMRAQGRCNGTPGEPPRPVRLSASELRRNRNRLAAQRWRDRQRDLIVAGRAG
jgi:hypothetical protein